MSEILTINTEPNITPLPVYGDDYHMLRQKMPLYESPLPNAKMNELSKRLEMTRKLYDGVGLSANQCGVNIRMFIMGFGDQVYACINPEIVEQSEELVDDQEGCLSFPGLILRVKIPRWIQAKYTNKHGEIVEERFEGLTARCYLHELDHMNGIRFVDKVGKVSLDKARRKQAKLIKAVERKKRA